jgi:DNA-binding NarL/FixJ family response regulator
VPNIRVAVVDIYPIFREGVVQALRRCKDIAVVAQGATVKEAEQFARDLRPDVLLIETAVPGSLRAAQMILRTHKSVKLIFLSSAEDQDCVNRAVRAGVQGYIMKGITGSDLVKAIQAVHGGERYITPDLAWRLVTMPPPATNKTVPLSLQELTVIEHTSRGLTNCEIANKMGVALSTIKYYKTRAFQKLGARNRLEAVAAHRRFAKQS